MRRTLLALLAATLLPLAATAGTVTSRDGKTIIGKIDFKATNQVLITPAGGSPTPVNLDDITHLSLADDSPAPAGPVVGDERLPAPWQQQDIGGVKFPGSAAEKNGTFSLTGSGWGIWGAKDSFHFVYQSLHGDGEIAANLVDVPTDDKPFLAGVTIRDGLDPAAAEASLILHTGGVARLNARPILGPSKIAPAGTKPYHWLRLIRAGDLFTSFCSADGTTWVPVGTVTAKMPLTVNVGLTCSSSINEDALSATFDHVTVRAEAMGPAQGIGLVDGTLLAGVPKSIDAKSLIYTDPQNTDHTLPIESVAFLFTCPLPADMRGTLPGGAAAPKTGILLATGDTIEGTIQSLANGKFMVVSLVFGPQTPDFAQVITAVLRPVTAAGTITVTTNNGSLYHCTGLAFTDSALTLTGGVLSPITLKPSDLATIDRE